MNLKPVDDSGAVGIEGFSYRNKYGHTEYVAVPNHRDIVKIVTIDGGDEEVANVAKSDIPNLIKALQAAYDHKD